MTDRTSLSSMSALAVLAPVFNDWASADVLLRELDSVAGANGIPVSVFLVDDGSSDPMPARFGRGPYANLKDVTLLRLACNLGHQRAIATGMVYLHKQYKDRSTFNALLVMDADGEDQPAHLRDLADSFIEHQGNRIVFAARSRRIESLSFKCFYQLYRMLYYLLTGVVVRFGNFSILPFHVLRRLTLMPDLWNNYPSAVLRSRFPYSMIPLARGVRYSGSSHMSFVSLINHGVSALSVFSDIVGTRLLLAALTLFFPLLVAALIVLAKYFITKEAIPGWTSNMMGLILAVFFQTIMLIFMALFNVVGRRSYVSFLPARDAEYFIDERRSLWRRSPEVTG